MVEQHVDEPPSRAQASETEAPPRDGDDEHAEMRLALDGIEGALDDAAATIARMS